MRSLSSIPRRRAATGRPGLWCVDSLGAYLRLRDAGVTTIEAAVELLAPSVGLTHDEFDVIADGLALVELEREDEARLDVLDLETVEALLST